jgi:hypothetical protein
LFLVRSKQLLLSKPGINTLGNTSQLFFSYEREEEYSRVVVLFNNNNNNNNNKSVLLFALLLLFG